MFESGNDGFLSTESIFALVDIVMDEAGASVEIDYSGACIGIEIDLDDDGLCFVEVINFDRGIKMIDRGVKVCDLETKLLGFVRKVAGGV